jgi:hypothetical protein
MHLFVSHFHVLISPQKSTSFRSEVPFSCIVHNWHHFRVFFGVLIQLKRTFIAIMYTIYITTIYALVSSQFRRSSFLMDLFFLVLLHKCWYEPEILSIIAVRSCVKKFLLFACVLFSCTTEIKFNWI